MRLVAAFGIALVLLAPSAFSQSIDDVMSGFEDTAEDEGSGASVDDVLEGFDTGPNRGVEDAAEPRRPSRLQLHGDALLSAAYAYAEDPPMPDDRLTRLRAELRLNLSMDITRTSEAYVSARGMHDFAFALNGREEYTDEHLDSMESEAELFEAWVRWRFMANASVKAGRQIVVWGTSDNLRITDVINPLDSREPGMVDIEDLRLPVAMTKLSLFSGNTTFSAMAIHERRFDKRPAFGSDYYPADAPPPDEKEPGGGLGQTEFAFSFTTYQRGFDLSAYAASVYQNTPKPAFTDGTPASIALMHDRVRMLGIAFAGTLGNILLKSEAAHFSEIHRTNTRDTSERLDAMLGVEYSGFTNTTLTVETAVRHVLDHEDAMEAAPDAVEETRRETALRITRSFFREQLNATLVIIATGEGLDEGGFVRASADVELDEGITLTAGAIDYYGNREPFDAISTADRVFSSLEFAF